MRIHDPKTYTIELTDNTPTPWGATGAAALRAMLLLASQLPDSAERRSNYWGTVGLGGEFFEPNTRLLLSMRSVANKQLVPVPLSAHVVRFFTANDAIQLGQIVSIGATGLVEPGTDPADKIFGVAMMDAALGQPVAVCTAGVWYVQCQPASVIPMYADITTDGVGRAVQAVPGNVACGANIVGTNYSVSGRTCRLMQISRPITLA